jgi:hypothetical protein
MTISLPQTSGTQIIPKRVNESSTFPSSPRFRAIPSTAAVSTTSVPKLRNLRTGDAREADYEIAWAAYKRIEPRYSRTNRMLADM